MKSAIDRSILSNRRKSENCKENSQSLSHRAKILKEQVPIKKSKRKHYIINCFYLITKILVLKY